MSVAVETAVSIDAIEEALVEAGMYPEYVGEDDGTTYTITYGDKEIQIFNAVSGDSFVAENLSSASYYFGIIGKDVTRAFEDVETLEEFMAAVRDCMEMNFMPR
jgi:hypothetical protein